MRSVALAERRLTGESEANASQTASARKRNVSLRRSDSSVAKSGGAYARCLRRATVMTHSRSHCGSLNIEKRGSTD
ncbi:hypothetical protein F4Z99_19345 [Candidatus Poribacteria bacterium]|nr:hypothetical protein [Candidatus Poribacteria bacterium]MYA98640.1 hypothetical protein [Candidatus Poribacteria bacterium]